MRVTYGSNNVKIKLNSPALNRSENAASGYAGESVEGLGAERRTGAERRRVVRRERSVKWSVIAFYGFLKRWSVCRVKQIRRILSFMALGRVRDADGAGVWDGAEVEYADRGSRQKSETLIHSTHIHTQPRSDGATPEERRQAEASRECAGDGREQAQGVELQSPASVGVTVNRYDVTLICFIK
jgi:hypothetical protein